VARKESLLLGGRRVALRLDDVDEDVVLESQRGGECGLLMLGGWRRCLSSGCWPSGW
jgi:hypothetical protein